jgi:uncharacterized protein with GYD domain
MPLYMYQVAYTSESIANMVKEPQDRIERAAQPLVKSIGGKLLAAGYAFGDYDAMIVYEAPDDQAAASLALAGVNSSSEGQKGMGNPLRRVSLFG